MGVGGARLTPPLKRARMMLPNTRQQPRAQSPKKVVIPGCEDLKTYSSPDILICGNCRELFSTLSDFIDHKRSYCKLRFTCKCSSFIGQQKGEESASLLCALCKETFASAFDLMVHAQAAHMVNIYQLGSKDSTASSAAESTAGSDVGGDVGGDASTDGGDSNSQAGEEAAARTEDTPKENGVSDTTEDHEMTDLVNGASPDQAGAADVTAAPQVPVPQEAAAVVTQ